MLAASKPVQARFAYKKANAKMTRVSSGSTKPPAVVCFVYIYTVTNTMAQKSRLLEDLYIIV